MRIYADGKLLHNFRKLLFRSEQSFLGKLIGFNVSLDAADKVHVYPVYRHALAFDRRPGQLIIELALGTDKSLIVSISGRGIETRILKPNISDIGKEDQ